MTDLEVDDLLWRMLGSLLPPRNRRTKGRCPLADDRACLRGILFVLRTDCPWRDVPEGFGASGVTCWRSLRDWQAAGAWERLHKARRLMLGEGLDAASAGYKVGYDDPSHFSRDYRRKFGEPPMRDMERLPSAVLIDGLELNLRARP